MRQGQVPHGTVTLLFTDIEGSTKLWEAHPEAMRVALARHDALLRAAIETSGGFVFKTIGDAFCAAFEFADDAIQAALTAQLALAIEVWPDPVAIKVRTALHSGAVESRDNDYFGPPVNRVARLLSAAHGGQTLLSRSAFERLSQPITSPLALKDLGLHQLKDLSEPEQVFQLLHERLPAEFPPIRSLSTHPNNLPQQLTSFIGRELETEDLKSLLERSRLVTLTGSGGTGKTRLGLQVAANSLERFPDGVWMVELAPLTDAERVPSTVANVLGVKEETERAILEGIKDRLKAQNLLLILDNCEHLLDACAMLADTILRSCPDIKILATSREGLGISGEQRYRVPSLSLPNIDLRSSPLRINDYEAVRLFVDRAQLHQPQFAVTTANETALASICSRLDGIPLAIELAAARVRTFSLEDIESKLDHRFRLLTGGSRTELPRQQTLKALTDWSYELLNDLEKGLLRRLSVFAGGFDLEGCERVCSDHEIDAFEVMELLNSLCDKSLVIADHLGNRTRYRLLETVRQYGRDLLIEHGEDVHWRSQHLRYFLELAQRSESNLGGQDSQIWLDLLDLEFENFAVAMENSLTDPEGPSLGQRLGAALWRFWMMRGQVFAGRRMIRKVLEVSDCDQPTKELAKCLHSAGTLSIIQTDYDDARRLLGLAADMAHEVGELGAEAGSRVNLATIEQSDGDLERALAQFKVSLAIFEELGDVRGESIALTCLGSVSCDLRDLESAERYIRRSIEIARKQGNREALTNGLNNLGVVLRNGGHEAAAREAYEESLSIAIELGLVWDISMTKVNLATCARMRDEPLAAREFLLAAKDSLIKIGNRRHQSNWLDEASWVELSLGNPEQALKLMAAAESILRSVEDVKKPYEELVQDQLISALRKSVSPERWDEIWKAGAKEYGDPEIEALMAELGRAQVTR